MISLKNDFARNLVTLSSGTLIAQAIPMLATLVLSRLYSPAEMGEWGVFSSCASILAVIGCLRYENAIVKPSRRVDAYNLAFVSILIALAFTGCLYLIVFAVDIFRFNHWFSLGREALYILPFYVLCLLLIQILNNLANKTQQYRSLAFSSVGRSLTQAISRITLGYCSFTNVGLIAGANTGALFQVFLLSIRLRLKHFFLRTFSFKRARRLLWEYRDFPKYDLVSNVFNSVSSNIPVILLSYFFIEDIAGYFSMALTLLFIPMSIIGTSLGQLYYRDACELHAKGESVGTLTMKIFVPTYIGCSIFMLGLIWGGETVFGFLLGSKWATVGKYATYLSLWLLLVSSISPLSSIFYVKNKQRINLCINVTALVLRIVVLFAGGYYLQSSDWTIVLFGIVSFLLFVVQGAIIKKIAGVVFSNKVLFYLSGMTVVLMLSYMWRIFLWLS